MSKNFLETFNFNDISQKAMSKAETDADCIKRLETKNKIFEKNPAAVDALTELDELLSEYYELKARILFETISGEVVSFFHRSG